MISRTFRGIRSMLIQFNPVVTGRETALPD
jgi:hypothetical protein